MVLGTKGAASVRIALLMELGMKAEAEVLNPDLDFTGALESEPAPEPALEEALAGEVVPALVALVLV